jgi:dihydrolipoamide dehydrogenase
MKRGLSVGDIADSIHAHPTLAEGIMEAAEDVHGEAIHVPKK